MLHWSHYSRKIDNKTRRVLLHPPWEPNELLDFDGSTDSLELLGDLLGFFLGDSFLDGLGSGLNHVLGFFQAQAGNDFTDNLDDLDLFGAGILQHDIEFGLFFGFSSSGTAGSGSTGHGDRAGHTEFFFHFVNEFFHLKQSHGLNGFENFLISH